ncbi:MAG: hypothetical protein JNM89_02135 [Hyphomicrobiaceae bacterium]|nr:hypothetical protein [Hyphomicrobiaceae bacterium]
MAPYTLTALVIAAAAVTGPALAAEPAYVGVWSKRMEHCSTKQDKPGAPMVVTEKGFDQHDLHCSFEKIAPVAAPASGSPAVPELSVLANCEWKGNATKMEMTWSVSGETLSITDKGGITQLKKCVKPSPATGTGKN